MNSAGHGQYVSIRFGLFLSLSTKEKKGQKEKKQRWSSLELSLIII